MAADIARAALGRRDRLIEHHKTHAPYQWGDMDSARRYLETLKSITVHVQGTRAVRAAAHKHIEVWGYTASEVLDVDIPDEVFENARIERGRHEGEYQLVF